MKLESYGPDWHYITIDRGKLDFNCMYKEQYKGLLP